MFVKEILKFNDLKEPRELKAGEVVYLQKKKKRAQKGLDKYVSEGETSLWEISQRFAVRIDNICRLNGISRDHVLREGDILNLR